MHRVTLCTGREHMFCITSPCLYTSHRQLFAAFATRLDTTRETATIMEKIRGISRQPSSSFLRRNILTSMLMSTQCRFLTFLSIIFSVGLLFGMYFTWKTDIGLLSQKLKHYVKQEEEMASPTVNTKKEFDAQITDYLPRKVFIDSSLGPPNSLELFMETYPDAQMYTIYAFLADSTYKPLYETFSNVNLYSGSVPSTSQNTTNMVISVERMHKESSINQSMKISTVDFSAWLKDNVHPDEYVIVKLTTDTENEEQVVKQLVATRALEWIDKLYTTTANMNVVAFAKEQFDSAESKKVFLWDDNKLTYSDFEDVNPPRIQEGASMSKCAMPNSTGFALLLYFSQLNMHAIAGIDVLQKVAAIRNHKLPLTLFLPLEYLHSHCHLLLSLASQMDLGLYLQDSSFAAALLDDDQARYNWMRNKLVFAEHCFASSNLTLTYTVSKSAILKTESLDTSEFDNLLNKLTESRKYTTVSNVQDITAFSQKTSGDSQKMLEEFGNGGTKAIDISVDGGNKLVLHLLTANISSLFPIQLCADK